MKRKKKKKAVKRYLGEGRAGKKSRKGGRKKEMPERRGKNRQAPKKGEGGWASRENGKKVSLPGFQG